MAEAPPACADPAARAVVAPWRRVLDAGSWAALLQRHVLVKLSHVLSALVINPADQQLGPLEAVLAWVAPRVERAILGVPQPTLTRLRLTLLAPGCAAHTRRPWVSR